MQLSRDRQSPSLAHGASAAFTSLHRPPGGFAGGAIASVPTQTWTGPRSVHGAMPSPTRLPAKSS